MTPLLILGAIVILCVATAAGIEMLTLKSLDDDQDAPPAPTYEEAAARFHEVVHAAPPAVNHDEGAEPLLPSAADDLTDFSGAGSADADHVVDDTWGVKALRPIAKEMQIPGWWNLRKDALIKAINAG